MKRAYAVARFLDVGQLGKEGMNFSPGRPEVMAAPGSGATQCTSSASRTTWELKAREQLTGSQLSPSRAKGCYRGSISRSSKKTFDDQLLKAKRSYPSPA